MATILALATTAAVARLGSTLCLMHYAIVQVGLAEVYRITQVADEVHWPEWRTGLCAYALMHMHVHRACSRAQPRIDVLLLPFGSSAARPSRMRFEACVGTPVSCHVSASQQVAEDMQDPL